MGFQKVTASHKCFMIEIIAFHIQPFQILVTQIHQEPISIDSAPVVSSEIQHIGVFHSAF